jgi:aminopeptidase
MKKTILKKYARLIARSGVNVQKGQEVIIQAGLDQPDFVKTLAEECYKCGASKVNVEWSYQPVQKLHVRYRSAKVLSRVEPWEEAKLQHKVDKLPCIISLMSDDPDGLKGINQEKLMRSQQKRNTVIKPYRDKMEGKYQWCVAGVPGIGWARKVFPDTPKAQAVEKLWQAIISTSRVDDDPVEAWHQHDIDLKKRCDYLNALGMEELEYSASNGTHLTIGLIPEAKFCGGGETSINGVYFNPNIPSEECFTTPMREKVNGIVYSTKPLSYQSQLIENFSIRFENGRAVEVKAEKNQALLEKMISVDEGACYLGECALVPYDSPINKSGVLFYNTLYDENACCHLALGRGYIDTFENYDQRTAEQMHEMGLNDSMIHEDFMIGTPDLSIKAKCHDGSVVDIFKNGTWAFEV